MTQAPDETAAEPPPLLTFHGAAGQVTGSCALLQAARARVLVDCGMFQGSKAIKAFNYQDFPFDPRTVDAVLLTHAHIDHSGLLPKLVRAGFRGPIFATAPTRELCAVMLADSAEVQARDVEHLNRRNERRGIAAVEPIYRGADVERTMEQFRSAKAGEAMAVAPGVAATWHYSGHLLGAASIAVEVQRRPEPVQILFSGDLGSGKQPFLPTPDGPRGVQHVVLESTYGDRLRDDLDLDGRRARLADELRRARSLGGPLVMPVFAIGRTQEILLDLLAVMAAEPDLGGHLFLDSPLAIEANDVFLRRGWNADVASNPFLPLKGAPRLHLLTTMEQSDSLERLADWHVILAGSGMCDGGRVRKHLARLLWRESATVLLTGYQASGTLGRVLQNGAEWVRLQGEDVRVRASIRTLDVYSGHADADGLADWLRARGPVAGSVLLNHGEPRSVAALAERLGAAGLAAHVLAAELDRPYALGARAAPAAAPASLRAALAGQGDWRDRRGAFLTALSARLESLPDDDARAALLERLGALVTPR